MAQQSKVAQKIRRIAYKARARAEVIARREGFADDLFQFCARGAVILWSELNKAGFKTQIVYNPGHVFCYTSGYYVDITATQFGESFGKTMVRLEQSVESLNIKHYARHGELLFPDWSIDYAWRVFDSPQSLQAWQKTNNWTCKKGIVDLSDLMPVSKYHHIKNFPTDFIDVEYKEPPKTKEKEDKPDGQKDFNYIGRNTCRLLWRRIRVSWYFVSNFLTGLK